MVYGPKTAEDILDKITENMDALSSYACDFSASFKTTARGYSVSSYVTGREVIIDEDGIESIVGSVVANGRINNDGVTENAAFEMITKITFDTEDTDKNGTI